VPDTCGCDDFFSIFDRKSADEDRERYQRKGPDRTTGMLLDLLRPFVSTGTTVLDVGGGIGVIDQELLRAGAGHAVLVDASAASLDVARDEARRRHTLDRMEFVDGDFAHRAAGIDPADIVTLDRVVCCYPDAESLVGASAARARTAFGLVLPRDGWLTRTGVRLINLWFAFRRLTYRSYAHPNATIDRIAASEGLTAVSERATRFWRIVVFARQGDQT
jgi:SAM-dependent methyltransferase